MNTRDEEQLLAHLRLHLNIRKPDLEDCWAEGYQAAQEDLMEDVNPYPEDSPEFCHWQEGWWSGFYQEEPVFELPEFYTEEQFTIPQRAAANDSAWPQHALKTWVERSGAMAATVAAAALIGILVDVI